MDNDKKIKEKYEEYYNESDVGKLRVIKEIDDMKTTTDNFEYKFYPDYNDENFIFNISRRLEFFHLKSLFNITELSKKCPSGDIKNDPFNFELTNNQQFLKNFMNNKTPYKGLVIFHGVGVGKTCSAINISSSYRDLFYKNNKKIICLVPKNIRGGWENTIYDPSKGEHQCSGDSFEDIIVRDRKGNVSKKDVKNIDIIKAMMPGGSVIGCPKISTLNLLNKQEKENRNIYTGCFGYIKFNGDMRFNIIIRSILNFKKFSEISVASGVVVDSNANHEFNENYIKAKALIDLFK